MEERWSSKVFMDTGSNELFLKTTELHSQANRRISQIFLGFFCLQFRHR